MSTCPSSKYDIPDMISFYCCIFVSKCHTNLPFPFISLVLLLLLKVFFVFGTSVDLWCTTWQLHVYYPNN